MRRCPACRAAMTSPRGWRCVVCGNDPVVKDGVTLLAPPLDGGEGGFDASGFAELYEVESKHFWFRARNALLASTIRQHFPGARTMLEVGCGTGFVLAHLEATFPDVAFVGGEAFTEALVFAATRVKRAELLRLDVRKLPFSAEFDVVGAFDVLEHVPEDEAALAAIFEATRPGGGVVFTVPQHRWLWSRADEVAHHVRRYTRDELVEKTTRAGFEVVRATSFVSALLPVMVASRVAAKLSRAPEEASAREYAPPRLVNLAFEAALAAERRVLRAGASLPVGGSLLVVARRPS